MKNKVLAALLSVCLFAGLAVPAFAYVDVNNSTLTAAAEEGKVIKTRETEVSIQNGKSANLLDHVSLLVDDTLAADPSELVWDLDDPNGAFVNSGENYSAIADKGTAYAVISTADGEAELRIKLIATAADKEKRDATGFKFASTKYDIVGNNGTDTVNADTVIKIVPSNSNAKFTDGQVTKLTAFATKLQGANALATTATLGAVAGAAIDENTAFTITITAANATSLLTNGSVKWTGAKIVDGDPATSYIAEFSAPTGATTPVTSNNKMTLTIVDFTGGNNRSASTTLKVVNPIKAVDVRNNGTVNIAVGEELDLNSKVKIIPTSFNNLTKNAATDDTGFTYELDYYNDTAEDCDFVALSGNKIRGVKVGRLKIRATSTDTSGTSNQIDGATTTFVVNVTPFAGAAAKADTDTPLVAPQRTLKVGQTFTVTLGSEVTAEESATATYGSLHEDIATVSDKGVVTAVKAGEAKIWVQVDGYAKGYYTVTVTDGSSTNVPQTAVVALAPLF